MSIPLTLVANVDSSKTISYNLIRYFSPFYYLELCLFSPKYDINGDIVTPIGLKSIITCVIGNGVIIAGWFWRITAPDNFLEISSQIPNQLHVFMTHLTHHFNYCILMIGFSINMINVLTQRQNNVKIFEKIQKVISIFQIDEAKFKKCILRNWLICVINFFIFISAYVCNHLIVVNPKTNRYLNLLLDIPLLILDVNMMHAISTVVLIKNIAITMKQTVTARNFVSNERICEITYKSNVGLLQTFELYKTIYQDLVRK